MTGNGFGCGKEIGPLESRSAQAASGDPTGREGSVFKENENEDFARKFGLVLSWRRLGDSVIGHFPAAFMKRFLPLALSVAGCLSPALEAADKPAEPDYPVTEDSKPHDGVPKGELFDFTFADSKIFPG